MIARLTRGKGSSLLLMVMIYSLALPMPALAMPQGGQVVSGQTSISMTNPQTMNIQQGTSKTILNWQQFSIAQPEAVHFMQPSAAAVALNRVVGVDPSAIHGLLSANGRIFLINPNGVLVGPTGRIETAGFVASTLDMANHDFLNGNYTFVQDPAQPLAAILNQGLIQAAQGGNVSLIAPGVENEGTILANLGSVSLGAGEQVTLAFAGNDMIRFAVDAPVTGQVIGPDGTPLEDTLLNSGTISADGGEVILSARSVFDAVKSVVNNSGVIEAKTIADENGIIRLEGGDQGIVYNSGTLDVSGNDDGETGGEVIVTGEKVGLVHYSEILAKGRKGGGKVLIGGGFQGKNPDVPNAKRTYVGKDAVINADAIESGGGGQVIVWSDEVTHFYGSISVPGGAQGGDGGFVEISGHEALIYRGTATGGAQPGYHRGTILFDPLDITLAGAGSTQNPTDVAAPGVDVAFNALPDATTSITLQVNDTTDFNNFDEVRLQADRDIILTAPWNVNTSIGGGTNASVHLAAGRDIDIQNNTGITAANVGGTDADITLLAARDITIGTNSNITTNSNGTITIRADATTAQLGFTATGADSLGLAGDGTGALTIDSNLTGPGGITLSAASASTVSGNIVGSGGAVAIEGGGNMSLSGIVSGTGTTLTKSGAGTLTLSDANTYDGATAVNAGTLSVTVDQALGTTAAGTTVASGAVLDFNNVAYTTAEALTVDGGTVSTSSGTSSFAGGITLDASSAVDVTGTQLTLSGVIDDGVGTFDLSKTGGGIAILSNTNTYDGSTSVTLGVLGVGADGALGTTAAGTTVASGATLAFANNVNYATTEAVSLAGPGAGSGGALRNESGTNSFAGAITLTADATILSSAGSLTLSGGVTGASDLTFDGDGDITESGAIADGVAATNVIKNGLGTLTLSGINTYGGTTSVNAGTLSVTVDQALGTTAAGTTVASGAVLDFNNVAYTTAEALTVDGGTVSTSSGTSSFAGGITLDASSAVDVTGTQLTLSGVIDDGVGTFDLSKTGGGIAIISNTNTYGGATNINAGALELGASGVIPDGSAVVLADVAGAVLDLSGNDETIGSLSGGGVTGGNVTLGAGTLTTGVDGSSTSYSGEISGSGGLVKAGGGTFTLSGINTYGGTTSVNAGTLSVTVDQALGTTAAGTTVASGATLAFANNVNYATTEVVSLAGPGAGSGGALRNESGNNSFAGAITLTADSTILSAAGSITLSGGVIGARDLTIEGAGNFLESGVINVGDGIGVSITINSTGTTEFQNTVQTASGISQADTAGTVTFQDNVTNGSRRRYGQHV